MPGADAPAASYAKVESTRTRVDRSTGNNPAFPHARLVLTAAPCSPWCIGLFSHHRLPIIIDKLDPSVGGSGPHDLAVRDLLDSSDEAARVHRIPRHVS